MQDQKQMTEKERKELEWQVVAHAPIPFPQLSKYKSIGFPPTVDYCCEGASACSRDVSVLCRYPLGMDNYQKWR